MHFKSRSGLHYGGWSGKRVDMTRKTTLSGRQRERGGIELKGIGGNDGHTVKVGHMRRDTTIAMDKTIGKEKQVET